MYTKRPKNAYAPLIRVVNLCLLTFIAALFYLAERPVPTHAHASEVKSGVVISKPEFYYHLVEERHTLVARVKGNDGDTYWATWSDATYPNIRQGSHVLLESCCTQGGDTEYQGPLFFVRGLAAQ